MLTLKSEAGSFSFPRLWNGPPKAGGIGPGRVRRPGGTTRRRKLRLPLPTVRGHANVRKERFLTGPALTPRPSAAIARARPRAVAADRTVYSELRRLQRRHAISRGAYYRYRGSWARALSTVKRLGGTRAAELEAVIQNLHAIAATGQLTASPLPVPV